MNKVEAMEMELEMFQYAYEHPEKSDWYEAKALFNMDEIMDGAPNSCGLCLMYMANGCIGCPVSSGRSNGCAQLMARYRRQSPEWRKEVMSGYIAEIKKEIERLKTEVEE